MAKTTNPTAPASVTRGETKELIDELLREALRSQARDLEQHLNSIHLRLQALEARK